MNELTNFLGGNLWSDPLQRGSFLTKKLPYGVQNKKNLPDPISAGQYVLSCAQACYKETFC